MVRPTNVHTDGGESRGGMKDEVLSSILSDGTTYNGEGPTRPSLLFVARAMLALIRSSEIRTPMPICTCTFG